MRLISEHGNDFHINDDLIPENTKDWFWNKCYLFSEEVELEECWVASVYRKNWDHGRNPEYEYAGEKLYDHEPSKEELLWLMAHFDSVRNGYVTVEKALRYHEVYD